MSARADIVASMRLGDAVATEALRWVGTPFVWMGSQRAQGDCKGGCDCKGLVAGVARALGRSEGDSLQAIAADYGKGRVDTHRLRAGLDALFDRVARGVGDPDPSIEAGIRPGDILLLEIKGRAQHLAITSEAANGRPLMMVHALDHRPWQVREVPVCDWWWARLAGAWRWREVDRGRINGSAT